MLFHFKTSSIRLFTISILGIILLLSSQDSIAQSKSNKGKEFWLGFMKHAEGTGAGMSLYITSDSSTTGTVSIPGQSWSSNYSVTANSLTVVSIPVSKAYMSCSDCKQSRAIKVVSQKPVVVYAHHYEGNKSDATLVLPSRTQGKDYYLVSYQENSSSWFSSGGKNAFIIIATKDNTKVNITPTCNLRASSGGTLSSGSKYSITLNEGETYQALSTSGSTSGDVTGTHIEVIDTGATANCRTVAVFAGSTYTRIGSCSGGIKSGDNLFEQMFPTNSWGKNFVLVPALGRSGDRFKFLASEDNTQVTIFKSSGAPDVYNINAGQSFSINSQSNVRNVIASKPICVAQFQVTANCDGSSNRIGDPSMTILNPLEQTLKDITVYSSRYYDIDNHYINVVIPSWATSGFRIDGSSASFTSVPSSTTHSYARLTVSAGNHRLTAPEGFIATAYGEGEYESYGYAAGANIIDLTAVANVTNSPQTNELSGCIGRAMTFSGSAEYSVSKWEWQFGDGGTDTVQNPSHLYTDTGTYTAKLYTYKPTFDGCSSYDSSLIQVKIYGTPTALITYDNMCDSSTAVFKDVSTIPSPETYLTSNWSIDGGALKYGKIATQYFDVIKKYNVRMIVTTTHQCRDTFTDSLAVNPVPIAFFTVANSCFYDSTLIASSSTISSGNIAEFNWELGNGHTDTLDSYKHFFSDSGRYSILLSIVSDSGCSSSYIDSMYKHPRMNVSFMGGDTCIGSTTVLTNTSVIDGGNFTDTTWYTTLPDTSHTYNYSRLFSNVGKYTVQLIMEQDSFCRDTFTKEIDVSPYAIPDFSTSMLCLGDSTLFSDKSSLSSGSYSLDWNWDMGSFKGDSQKIKYPSGGEKFVLLTVTTDKGCVSDSSKPFNIYYPSITSIDVSDACEGSSQDIGSVNVMGLDSFSTYQWTIEGTQVSTDSSFNYTTITTGKKHITLNVTTLHGCSISLQDSFNDYITPQSGFIASGVCSGDSIIASNTSSIKLPAKVSKYNWYLNNILVSSDSTPRIPTSSFGVSKLRLEVISEDNCIDSTVKNVFIHPNPSNSFTTASTCLNDVTTFNSTSTIVIPDVITNYKWLVDGNNLFGITANYKFPSVNSYVVQLVSISNFNCTDTLEKTIVIDPLPVINIDLDSFGGCVPFEINIKNNSTIANGAISTYNWTWGNGNKSTGDMSSYTYTSVGTFKMKIKATSDKGCSDSLTLGRDVIVYPSPSADFSFNPIDPSNLTEFVTFKDSSSSDVIDWRWSISDGSAYTGKTFNHSFVDSGSYAVSLEVRNSNDCIDTETKIIYVDADLFVHIPTAFSPNGDFLNDEFGIGGLTQGVVDMQLDVFNRWGEKLFHSEDVNKKWNGRYKGLLVEPGSYLYIISFTNPKRTEIFRYKGTVTLFR